MKILGGMGHFSIDHLFAGLCCIETLQEYLENNHASDF